MNTFHNREKGFESRYAHDAELQFRVRSRRDYLLGLWVAEQLDLSGDEAKEYAKSVVNANFEEAGDQDMIRKIVADITTAEIEGINEQEIRFQLDKCEAKAKTEVMEEEE
ncbi:MAG: aldolase [Rickettsiales bacterium]|jgi:hypothetical protein|nr:aldolase [Rickettsiales bacterium]